MPNGKPDMSKAKPYAYNIKATATARTCVEINDV